MVDELFKYVYTYCPASGRYPMGIIWIIGDGYHSRKRLYSHGLKHWVYNAQHG